MCGIEYRYEHEVESGLHLNQKYFLKLAQTYLTILSNHKVTYIAQVIFASARYLIVTIINLPDFDIKKTYLSLKHN